MKKCLLLLCLLLCFTCLHCACEDTEPSANDPTTQNSTHTHTWGDWAIVNSATCVDGKELRVCPCGEVEKRVIPATQDHSYTVQVPKEKYLKSSANCESAAIYYYKCASCDGKSEETYSFGEPVHDFKKRVQTADYLKSSATCEAYAEYYYKCALCEEHGTETYMVGSKLAHNLNETTHICSMCNNAYIYFGEYPQTVKADGVTILSETDSRGYYKGSDDAWYAKISSAKTYKGSTFLFSNGSLVQPGKEYYFKVEPILWRVLSQEGGRALVLCENIIANMANDSDDTISSYADNAIRIWLNDSFFNTAFKENDRSKILTTNVINDRGSLGSADTNFVCENTEDKLFLLSYDEVTNEEYGFVIDQDRAMTVSDYCRATGIYVYLGDSNYYGCGAWWLRTFKQPGNIFHVYWYDGGVNHYSVSSRDYIGVLPAMNIVLS